MPEHPVCFWCRGLAIVQATRPVVSLTLPKAVWRQEKQWWFHHECLGKFLATLKPVEVSDGY